VTVCAVGDLLVSHELYAVISGPVPRYRVVIGPLASSAGCGGRGSAPLQAACRFICEAAVK
jgi:hypothetical protein